MGKKRNREFWESAGNNNASYIQYYNRLTELSISMFEWKNLPPNVDSRFLELTLFTSGQAVFFPDKDLVLPGSPENAQYVALKNMPQGGFDIYGIPKNRMAFGYNGYRKKLNQDNSVIIYNNLLHTNSMLDVRMFAQRLYNLDRTIDVNTNAQKTPVLILCDENERLTMENLYMKWQGNAPVIYGEKSLNTNGIKVLTTEAPYISDKLYQLKTQIWNEALTYLGISNINITKKERLITDEVTRNQGGVIASRYSRLEARRNACREINAKFGLKIWCDYREDFQIVENEAVIDDSDTFGEVDEIE